MKQLLLLALLSSSLSFSQGKLKKAKQNLDTKSTSVTINSGTRTGRRTTSTRKNKNKNRYFDSFFAELAFYASLGIVVGEVQERDLNPYPYFYDNEGEYAAELSETGRKQSLNVGVNYLFAKPNAFELNAIYKPLPIIGIAASYTHFSEKNSINADVLDVTSILVNYYRIREKNISIWWGIGATYVGSGVNKLGFAYSLGTEIYPIKPISLHLSWKESFINESEIGVFKAQLKYHLKNKAFFAGYHVYQLGGEDISAPSVGFEITF